LVRVQFSSAKIEGQVTNCPGRNAVSLGWRSVEELEAEIRPFPAEHAKFLEQREI